MGTGATPGSLAGKESRVVMWAMSGKPSRNRRFENVSEVLTLSVCRCDAWKVSLFWEFENKIRKICLMLWALDGSLGSDLVTHASFLVFCLPER